MTVNEFLAERRRFVTANQLPPTRVTLHPADYADLLLELKAWEAPLLPDCTTIFAGARVEVSKTQSIGRAYFEH